MRTLILASLLVLAIGISDAAAEDILLNEPIGIYVESYNDTVGNAMSELIYMYLNMRGYYPVNLNEVWKDKRKVRERRKLRKRAQKEDIESFIVVEINPDNDKDSYYWSAINLYSFEMKARVDFYESPRNKLPKFTRQYSKKIETVMKFDFGKYQFSLANASKPSMRLVTASVDSLFNDMPAREDTSHVDLVSIPTTIACDRGFRSHFGEDEWVREMAKPVVMANRVLARDLGVILHVQQSMIYDNIPEEVESLMDLGFHLTVEPLQLPEGVLVFFSSQNINPRNKALLGELGLAPILGRRVTVGLYPADRDSMPKESVMWDYLYEGMIVAHEVGHMLGAVHTDDHKSIMYPIANIVYPRFDQANRERVKRFLPMFLSGQSLVDSSDYPTLMSELSAIYPDSMEMMHALRSLMFDQGYGVEYLKAYPEMAEDVMYKIASGVHLVFMGMGQAARPQFVDAIEKGYRDPQLMIYVAFLFLEDDSPEDACLYFEMARENGLDLPQYPRCHEDSLAAWREKQEKPKD